MAMHLNCSLTGVTIYFTSGTPSLVQITLQTATISGSDPTSMPFSVNLEGTDLDSIRTAVVRTIRAAGEPADDAAAATLFATSLGSALSAAMVAKGWITIG